MNVPMVNNADRYVGLYSVDFGNHCALGLTAEEVAELLDSDTGRDVTVYKIYRAYPDGRMELKGVRRELFGLETGMFFYARDEQAAQDDFNRLCGLADTMMPPARAKVHFAANGSDSFVIALIYPAEYDDEFGRWLLDAGFRTEGVVEAGTNAVQRYYDAEWQILDRKQLWSQKAADSLRGQALHDAVRKGVVR